MNVAAELSRVLNGPVRRECDQLTRPAHDLVIEICVPAGMWDLKDAFDTDGRRFQ